MNWEGHDPRDGGLENVQEFVGILLEKLCLNTKGMRPHNVKGLGMP